MNKQIKYLTLLGTVMMIFSSCSVNNSFNNGSRGYSQGCAPTRTTIRRTPSDCGPTRSSILRNPTQCRPSQASYQRRPFLPQIRLSLGGGCPPGYGQRPQYRPQRHYTTGGNIRDARGNNLVYRPRYTRY